MNDPFLKIRQTPYGWQAGFAFQVFHRPPEEWSNMRWGFNEGVLLEEALDRYRLFVESQAAQEAEFLSGAAPDVALALRGIRFPEEPLKMILLGRYSAAEKDEAEKNGRRYARQIFASFPFDFILFPAETEDAYHRLSGESLLQSFPRVIQVQRARVPLQAEYRPPWLPGLWQTTSRSNEQIWRALGAMPHPALFNILVKPCVPYPQERQEFQKIKESLSAQGGDPTLAARLAWVENYIKRRQGVWKKFFLAQVHLAGDEGLEYLLRSIGAALTRDAGDRTHTGFEARIPETPQESRDWLEKIRLLELTESPMRLDDLADAEEVFAIFRFPYRHKTGLPGVDFEPLPDLSLG
jgi:hypothetical protein